MRILGEKTTFNRYDQEISGVSFEHFLDLERGQTVHNISKLKWKRDLQGIKVPHREINCENWLEVEKSQSYINDSKENCFDCEIAKSCKDCFTKITQIKTYATETNKLKRQSPNENGYMLLHYVEEVVENVIIEEKSQGCYKKCDKCFVESKDDNFIKKKIKEVVGDVIKGVEEKIELFDSFLLTSLSIINKC